MLQGKMDAWIVFPPQSMEQQNHFYLFIFVLSSHDSWMNRPYIATRGGFGPPCLAGIRSRHMFSQHQRSLMIHRLRFARKHSDTIIVDVSPNDTVPTIRDGSVSREGRGTGTGWHLEESTSSERRVVTSGSRQMMMGCLGIALAVFLITGMPEAVHAASTLHAEGLEPHGALAFLKKAVSFVLHLDVHLGDIVSKYGTITYAILFSIVFAETGLVVTPLLPGDSLLFATGALAALGKLNLVVLLALYATAATVGDAVNYSIGKYFGMKALKARLIKKEYMEKTEQYYARYGGKTIVLARFVPIVRTFAPFVAGVGSMAYKTFALYNVFGAALWTGVCVGAGYLFGNIPAVHQNFSLVVLGIIAVSVLPVVYELISIRMKSRNGSGRVGSVQRQGNSLSVRF